MLYIYIYIYIYICMYNTNTDIYIYNLFESSYFAQRAERRKSLLNYVSSKVLSEETKKESKNANVVGMKMVGDIYWSINQSSGQENSKRYKIYR